MRCHLVSMPVLVCSLSITRIHAWEEDDFALIQKEIRMIPDASWCLQTATPVCLVIPLF